VADNMVRLRTDPTSYYRCEGCGAGWQMVNIEDPPRQDLASSCPVCGATGPRCLTDADVRQAMVAIYRELSGADLEFSPAPGTTPEEYAAARGVMEMTREALGVFARSPAAWAPSGTVPAPAGEAVDQADEGAPPDA